MRSNAMDSVAEAYLEAVRLKLEQIAEIMKNNVNVDFKEPPSYEEQRKAMANPVEFQNLLGIAVIQLHNGQKIYYRFPYPLSTGAFLLKGKLRTPGFSIPSLKGPLDLEKSRVWAGEIYRLNGTINWLKGYTNQNRIKVAEKLQWNLMKWEQKQNVSSNFPLVDRTNPLSEVASIREIRFPTYPYQTDEYSLKDIPKRAKVHKSHVGRVCILETSDKKPGGVLYLAKGAHVQIKKGQSRIFSQYSNYLFGYSCSLVPFIQHNKPIRAIIGGRELKQALPLLKPVIPLVCTGVEGNVAEESGRVIRTRNSGKVVKVNWKTRGGEIQVKRDSDGKVDNYPLAGYCHVHSGEFQGGCYYEKTRVNNQHQVTKGEILAEGCGVKDGKVALGVNLLVVYMPWFGYNFEDAIVISEHAAKLLTSVHVYEGKDERDPEEIIVNVREGDKKIKYGTKLTDKVRFSRHIPDGEVVRILKSQDGLKIWILEKRPAEIGDKLTNRHGNKGVISLILPENKMPYFCVNGEKRVVDVILNPTSVISRVNLGQVLETHFAWVIHEIEYRDDLKEFKNNIDVLKNIGVPFKQVRVEQLNQLKNLLVKTGLCEYGKAEVRLTVNGGEEKLGSYVVGYQYFVKLRHLARDKLEAAGKTKERMPLPCQPKKGNSISEHGIWALIAHKADNLAQELLTVRSDDIKGNEGLKLGGPLKVSYPESLRLIVQYTRGLGLEVEANVPKNFKNSNSFSVEKIHAVMLRPATYKEMKNWSSFIDFDKPLNHPLYSQIKLNGVYEIPEAFRPYNIGDGKYELSRYYGRLKKKEGLEKSLRGFMEGVKIKETFRTSKGDTPRAEKGIFDFIRGKRGLFRKGSLGKRSDYSARAIIVPDPNLKINEISLPNVVWKELELKENEPILVVRYPVLHRYGTLAFYPQKRDDFAIGIPPLLCKGFGADFDGDLMTVFRAISHGAQKELENLFPTCHLYSSATGDLNLHLTQDFVLGKLGDQIALDEVQKSLLDQFQEAISTIEENPNHNEQKIHNAIEDKILKLQTEILKNATHSEISVSIFDIQELATHLTNGELPVNELKNLLKKNTQNPLCLMALSEARGKKWAQLREMVGQIGIIKMSDTEIYPIRTNFLKGLSGHDYYVYAQFARDILYQSSRAPQDPGAAVRKYYNKDGNLLITEHDCGTNEGITLTKKYLLGRVPVDNNTESLPLMENNLAGKNDGYELKVRSPLCCQSKSGICAMCYGWNLSTKKLPEKGWRVGAISVQSILENLYQAELKVIHKDPKEDWRNKVKEFKEAFEGYLFCWDNVPEKENDKKRILRFLRDDLDIDWAEENAKIFKTPDCKTIRIFKDENLVEIMIDEKKKKATLKICGGGLHNLKVKKENGKLNIYLEDKGKRALKLQKLLNVNTRHFEVLIRSERKNQGWLARASYRNAREVFKQAFKNPLEDKLEDFTSRLLLGQNPGQILPKYSDGEWVPLADLLPGEKATSKNSYHKQKIWSAFYLDEKTVVFVKWRKQDEELKKAINNMSWSDIVNIANNKNAQIKANITKSGCKDYAIVGPDGKEIPLQRLFEFKKPGHQKEALRKDIEEWLASLSENLKSLPFRKLAKRFKNARPKYNSESDDNIKNKLSDIFREQLKKDFPAWLNTIPEENLSQSPEELVKQFKKVYPKYGKMRTKTIINTVKEHIEHLTHM